MKVFRDGKEVKNAVVAYNSFGTADVVTVDGVTYDPKAFDFKEDEPVKKTTNTKRTAKVTKAKPAGDVLTTKNV